MAVDSNEQVYAIGQIGMSPFTVAEGTRLFLSAGGTRLFPWRIGAVQFYDAIANKSNQRQLEYDFVVKPGAEPNQMWTFGPTSTQPVSRLLLQNDGNVVIYACGATGRRWHGLEELSANIGVRRLLAADENFKVRVGTRPPGTKGHAFL